MNILIIGRYHIYDIPGGGQEVTMDVFAEHLVKMGHKVSIAAYNMNNGKPYKEDIKGYTAYRVRGIKNSFISRLGGFLNVTREVKPDIIMMSSYTYSMYGYFLAKATGCKVGSFAHDEFDVYGFRKPLDIVFWLNRKFTRRVNVISVNKNISKVIEKETGVVTPVCYTGFDLPDVDPKKEYRAASNEGSPFKFVYVGRITKEKGLDYIISCFELFLAYKPNSELVIIGDGNYLNELKNKKNNPKIIFKGYLEQEEMLRELASADCYLNGTYIKEGIVFSNIQAMKMGVPIIVTDTGASGEVVENSKTGFLVTPKRVTEMTAHMFVVAECPKAMESIAKRAMEYSKQFSGEEATKRLEGILNDILRT